MEKKKQNVFAISVITIVIVIEIISCITGVLSNATSKWSIIHIIACVEHLLALYYILAGYKKPHGNLLRYLMLAFVFTVLVETIVFINSASAPYTALTIICMVLMAYVSGRLNKIDQNKIIMSLILILFIVGGIVFLKENQIRGIMPCVEVFSKSLEWFVLCSAYFVRYKEHKEAGLTDK